MKKISFGIIGCGHIAQRHAKVITENNYAELVGVYDVDTEKAKNFSLNFSTQCFTLLHQLLNSTCDIVIICAPNGLHAQIAIEAVKANKHVLIEKPMDISIMACKNLIEIGKKNTKSIFVVKQNRYNPPVVFLKELIDKNKLGNIHLVSINCFWNRNENYYKNSEWRGTKMLDGGILFTQFSHFIDILFFLFGQPSEIKGFTSNTNHSYIDFEDNGVFSFKLLNGAIGSLTVTTNAFNQNMEGSITVFAQNATIKIGGQYLNKIDYLSANNIKMPNLAEGNLANDYGTYQGSMSNHDKVIDNVIKALNGQAHQITSAEEGLQVVEIISKFYQSITK